MRQFSLPPIRFRHYRGALLLSLVAIVPIGYGIRFAGNGWLNDVVGSVAYEIFWTLLILLIWPQTSPLKATIIVFLATCALEWLQLWHPAWLEAIRATLWGRLVFGNTFNWADFGAYVLGIPVAWAWARSLTGLRRRG